MQVRFLSGAFFYYESKGRFHSKDGHAARQMVGIRKVSVYYESKGRFHSKDGHAARQRTGIRKVSVYYESKGRFHSKDGHAARQRTGICMMSVTMKVRKWGHGVTFSIPVFCTSHDLQ